MQNKVRNSLFGKVLPFGSAFRNWLCFSKLTTNTHGLNRTRAFSVVAFVFPGARICGNDKPWNKSIRECPRSYFFFFLRATTRARSAHWPSASGSSRTSAGIS